MKNSITCVVVAAMLAVACCGCDKSNTTTASASAEQSSDFAPGAFPPILTDMEYHQNPWTRTDCLKCHELGLQDAPKIKHTSLPDIAADAKCRTCHVFVKGSKP